MQRWFSFLKLKGYVIARLPEPGGDGGNWGVILNDYLSQTHTNSGDLKAGTVGVSQLVDGAITEAKLDSAVQSKLNASGSGSVADDSISTAKLQNGAVTNPKLADDSVTNAKIAPGAAIAQSKIANLTTDLAGKANSTHTHTATQISDATATGRNVLTAASAAAARSAIGAGTSDLALGATSTTAMPGNYAPTKADIGLEEVDNTSDINKPISTAVQTALNGKQAAGSYVATNDSRLSDTRVPTDDTVSEVKLQDGAVTSAKLADASVTDGKLAAGTANNGQFLSYDGSNMIWTTVSSTTVSDATPSAKGIVQLAGDLAGTAGTPTVAKVNGVSLPMTAPSTGQVLTATGATAANWADPASAPVTSVAGKTGVVSLNKNDVDLANVDNTTDANKPISSATQTALDAKATRVNINQFQVPVRTSVGTGEANGGQGISSTATGSTLALRSSTGVLAAASGVSGTDVVNKSQLDTKLDASQKAAANGVASLNASTLVPTAQLGTGTADTSTYLRGDGSWQTVGTGSVASTDISDSTVVGREVLTATDGAAARTAVGLGSVNNTSDADKPISTATQTALDLKATRTSVSQYQLAARTSGGSGEPIHGISYSSSALPSTVVSRNASGIFAAADGVSGTDVVNKNQLDTKANTVHTHTASQVTDFNTAVDDRVATLLSAAPVIFEHGSNAAAIRPVTTASVWWVGSVTPTYWVDGDAWMDTSAGAPLPSMPSGLSADFYVTDITGADGSTVSTWNSRTGSQTFTATGAPVLHTTDRHIQFDGTDDYMDAPITNSNPETVVMVYQLPSTVASVPILGSSGSVHTVSVTSGSKIQTNAGTSLAAAANAPSLQWVFSAHVFDSTSSRVRVGDIDLTGNAGTNARSSARLATNSGATAFGNIKVKAVLFFNRSLTNTEVSDVKTILASELGMSL